MTTLGGERLDGLVAGNLLDLRLAAGLYQLLQDNSQRELHLTVIDNGCNYANQPPAEGVFPFLILADARIVECLVLGYRCPDGVSSYPLGAVVIIGKLWLGAVRCVMSTQSVPFASIELQPQSAMAIVTSTGSCRRTSMVTIAQCC